MSKTFSPILAQTLRDANKNFKDIQEKTKFESFIPTFADIPNAAAGIGYFALNGSLCYYLIECAPTGGTSLVVDWALIGNKPRVTNLPYGPLSVPGASGKVGGTAPAPQYSQALDCWAATSADVIGGAIVAGYPWAAITYDTGLPIIKLAGEVAGGTTTLPVDWKIYISGWFLRK